MIYQKLRDYRRACREMQQAVKLDATNPQVGAWYMCAWMQGGTTGRWVRCCKATAVVG